MKRQNGTDWGALFVWAPSHFSTHCIRVVPCVYCSSQPLPAWLGSHQSLCAYQIALGVNTRFAIITSPICHDGSDPSTMHNCARLWLELLFAMVFFCWCLCCKNIEHIVILKPLCAINQYHEHLLSPKISWFLHHSHSIIAQLRDQLSQGGQGDPVHDFALIRGAAIISAVFFIWDMQHTSFDCVWYHQNIYPKIKFILCHHRACCYIRIWHNNPVLAFTAPAIMICYDHQALAFTLPVTPRPWQKVIIQLYYFTSYEKMSLVLSRLIGSPCYDLYYGTQDMCTKARYKDQYVQGT